MAYLKLNGGHYEMQHNQIVLSYRILNAIDRLERKGMMTRIQTEHIMNELGVAMKKKGQDGESRTKYDRMLWELAAMGFLKYKKHRFVTRGTDTARSIVVRWRLNKQPKKDLETFNKAYEDYMAYRKAMAKRAEEHGE